MKGIKLHHFLLETVVMIFIILGFATAPRSTLLLGLLYCSFIVTLVQIIHSFILASLYGNDTRIHRWLKYYWRSISICFFLFMGLVASINFIGSEKDFPARTFFTWLIAIIPLAASIILWIITWQFRSWGREKF